MARLSHNARLSYTFQETNISSKNGILKMIFLFPRWDMLIPWRVTRIQPTELCRTFKEAKEALKYCQWAGAMHLFGNEKRAPKCWFRVYTPEN